MSTNHTNHNSPNWDVAIVDGQPETVINVAAVAEMVKHSPLGEETALAVMRAMLSTEHFAALESALCKS